MNKEGYIRIMRAAVNLIVVIMIEAGKVPIANAQKVGENILKAIGGGAAVKKD